MKKILEAPEKNDSGSAVNTSSSTAKIGGSNPSASATVPFNILGHFEEIIDIETGKCHGTRPVNYCIRPDHLSFRKGICMTCGEVHAPDYGYAGRLEKVFKKGEKIMIDKAHRGMQPYTFKADSRCWIMTHPICGRMK